MYLMLGVHNEIDIQKQKTHDKPKNGTRFKSLMGFGVLPLTKKLTVRSSPSTIDLGISCNRP